MDKRGQSIVEYIILIGIVVMAVYVMAPAFKRGVQGAIKQTSDQLAFQQNSDQDFSADTSHLDTSQTLTNVTKNNAVAEYSSPNGEMVNRMTSESTATLTNTLTNLGFSAQ